MRARMTRSPILASLLCLLLVNAQAQNQAPAAPEQMPNAPMPQQSTNAPQPAPLSIHTPSNLAIPHSHNPFDVYAPSPVPEPALANSPRLQHLIRDGKLYISLQDAIALALEDSLDLAIARYNLPIADTDIQRTKAGGSFRGVNTGIVQGTPGGGIGGFGTGAPGAGAGGTTSGAGGAGAGAAGLVQSTLGIGTPVQSYDPIVTATSGLEHLTQPVANVNYSQAFPTGTSFSFEVDNNRQTTNSIFGTLSPQLGAYYRVTFTQQLLAGFGTGPNKRYMRIAQNNKKISDIAFKSQVIATVTQIANIYWDLVSAYEGERVTEQSYAFAQQSLDNAKKQLQLEAVPAMDVMRAEAEVSRRDQDLTIAKTNLQLQESLLKNALTKNLDDPVLESMKVIPTDRLEPTDSAPAKPLEELTTVALQDRPELSESQIDLQNRQITRKAATNALLPTL